MKPNLEVRLLAKRFGIKVKRMRIIQNGVYRIETVRGKVYCLKRMPYPPTKLRWIDRTLQRLRQNSNLRLGWRNPKTREGRLLYARSGLPDAPPFVLIPWLRGKWPSPPFQETNEGMRYPACKIPSGRSTHP